jgi:hypothetical protein
VGFADRRSSRAVLQKLRKSLREIDLVHQSFWQDRGARAPVLASHPETLPHASRVASTQSRELEKTPFLWGRAAFFLLFGTPFHASCLVW